MLEALADFQDSRNTQSVNPGAAPGPAASGTAQMSADGASPSCLLRTSRWFSKGQKYQRGFR